jgi:hypothetical protein
MTVRCHIARYQTSLNIKAESFVDIHKLLHMVHASGVSTFYRVELVQLPLGMQSLPCKLKK